MFGRILCKGIWSLTSVDGSLGFYYKFDFTSTDWSVQIVCFFWLSLGQSVSSVQSLSRVWLFVTSWITACQASLSITNSQSSPKLMCIRSVMPSNNHILCLPLLLLPSIPPSIRVFSNESTLLMRWPKYWSFSLSIIPFNEHPGPISFRMDWLDLLALKSLGGFNRLLSQHSKCHTLIPH